MNRRGRIWINLLIRDYSFLDQFHQINKELKFIFIECIKYRTIEIEIATYSNLDYLMFRWDFGYSIIQRWTRIIKR